MPFKDLTIKDMLPNDNHAAPVPTVLAGFGVVAADGPQAAAFLQAQVMSDVAALAVGQWHWSGWLNAKGRVIAVFALLRTGDAAFRLLVPDLPAAQLQAALARFVFRTKVRLEALPDGLCVGEWQAAALPVRDVAVVEDGDFGLDLGGDTALRRLWLLSPDSTRPRAPADAANDAAWARCDLVHGLPRLPAEQREHWTPQMLSLQRLRAFSLKKGCYPGQEIVARTHFLGQAKRELVLLAGHGLRAGASVQVGEGQAAGTVVCNAADGTTALAVLAVDADAITLSIDGAPVERQALAGGLQRPA